MMGNPETREPGLYPTDKTARSGPQMTAQESQQATLVSREPEIRICSLSHRYLSIATGSNSAPLTEQESGTQQAWDKGWCGPHCNQISTETKLAFLKAEQNTSPSWESQKVAAFWMEPRICLWSCLSLCSRSIYLVEPFNYAIKKLSWNWLRNFREKLISCN